MGTLTSIVVILGWLEPSYTPTIFSWFLLFFSIFCDFLIIFYLFFTCFSNIDLKLIVLCWLWVYCNSTKYNSIIVLLFFHNISHIYYYYFLSILAQYIYLVYNHMISTSFTITFFIYAFAMLICFICATQLLLSTYSIS